MLKTHTQFQLRHFATSVTTKSSTSIGPTSLYTFKKQLDDYIYYHSLSSTWRPYVYRKRNADYLISKNALDKNNNPLIPQKFPGIPSKKKLTKFISLLLTIDEVKLLRDSLDNLFKIRTCKDKKKNIKYLEPSILNQYLYKSFQLDYKLYSENLMWLDQINENDSIWSVKNTEAVAFLDSLLIKYNYNLNNEINFDQFNKKLNHWIKKSKLSDNHSILFNSSSIIASIYSNSLSSNEIALNNLDKLTRNKVYNIKSDISDYLQYDHAYSIISALKDASIATNEAKENQQLQTLVSRWNKFLNDVETIKGNNKSTYELINASPVIIESAPESNIQSESLETKETNDETK